MPDNNAIIQALKENNPFMSSASPLPWDNNTPDLVQLNREASDEIEQLILHKRRLPSTPLAGLVFGEPGSGKTHMLTRMLRKLRKHAKLAIFVTVKTFVDSESVTYDLLSEILISLSQVHSSGKSQFDMLVNEVMRSYNERRLNDGFTDISKIDMRTYLAKDMKGINKNVLKCLMLYITTTDESVKWQIIDWLREGLDEEESHQLGLPVRDVSSMSIATRENEAQKILLSLGLLLSYANVPMIICFDQLDAMKSHELIAAWGSVINLLVNDLQGVLPLCFLRFTIWNDFIKPYLDTPVIQRLEHHIIVMKECSLAQAKLLIRGRVDAAFENSNPEEKYNWLMSRLDKKLKPGFSPRMVIDLANKEIQDAKPDDDNGGSKDGSGSNNNNDDKKEIFKIIRNAYSEECRKIKAQPSAYPPNPDHIAIALEVWLKFHEGFEATRYKDKRHLKIRGRYKGRDYAFYIVTAKIAYLAIGAMKQGIKLMEDNPGMRCFYISEAKFHAPSRKKSNETLEDFKDSGGRAYIIKEDDRAGWYGLKALIDRVDNGDVDLLLASGIRTATREDMKDFMLSLKPVEIEIDYNKLGYKLMDIIKVSPMKILAANKAVELLAEKKIIISDSELIAFVKSNLDVFKIFESKNEMLIGLTGKSK